jgi:hypothetical protein
MICREEPANYRVVVQRFGGRVMRPHILIGQSLTSTAQAITVDSNHPSQIILIAYNGSRLFQDQEDGHWLHAKERDQFQE